MYRPFPSKIRAGAAGATWLLAACLSPAATLHFNGSSAYVSAGARTELKVTGSALTLEAWIKPVGRGSDPTDGGVIFGREGEYILARFADGTIRYALTTTTPGWNWVNTGTIAPSNQWTHVALTYDGSSIAFYTNGVLRGLSGGSGALGDAVTAQNDFQIGNRQSAARYFHGQIDEVRIWNIARTSTEIAAAMARPLAGDEPGLLAVFGFDEGFGTSTASGRGDGLSATLVGGPVWDPASEAVARPVAVTRPATLVTETGARLNSSVDPKGAAATHSFWLSTHASAALSFDGVNDEVDFSLGPNSVDNLFPLTVTAWLKTDVPGINAGLVNKYTAGSLNGWHMNLINGQLRAFYFRNGSSNVFGGGDGLNGGNVDDGQWHHVAFTVGTGGGKLFVDGRMTAVTNWMGAPGATTNTQPVRLGAYGASLFAGQMSEVTLWKTELSSDAIDALRLAPPTSAHPQFAHLVAHWPLDEGAGAFANDVSGRHAAGILIGEPRWIPQARPDAFVATPATAVPATTGVLDLDGLDDHVRVPAGIWFSNEFTIECWVYARSVNSYSRIIDFGNGAPSDNVILTLTDGTTGRPGLTVFRGTSSQALSAPQPVPLNQWVHLAATLKSNLATLYFDGVAVASAAVTAPNAFPRGTNYIGRSPWTTDLYPDALYDDLRLWNRARTPAQLRQFMAAPVSPDDPNLILNYRFDESGGLVAIDSRTVAPQNGVLTNGVSRLPFARVSADVTGLSPASRYYVASAGANGVATEFGLTELFATPTPAAGNALEFNGTNSYVRVAGFGANVPTTNVTVEFWQRVHTVRIASVFGLEADNTANRFQAHVPYTDGIVYWDFGNSAAAGRLAYRPPVSLVGTWQHFAFVAKSPPNGFMRIYRNGVLEAQTNTASAVTASARDLVLGRFAAWNLDGELDEFRVWNVVREDSAILRDYNRRMAGDEPGLIGCWHMDEGAGSLVADATGRGSDGLRVNNPTWVPSTAPVGWPLVSGSGVDDIVLGDVTLGASVQGDNTTDTRVWVESGSYVPVPNSAINRAYFHTYPDVSSPLTNLAKVNFDGPPAAVKTFTNIDFWVTDYFPPPEWPEGVYDEFGARYVGRVFVPSSGTYTFYVASDDGSQLFVDGQLLVNNDYLHGRVERGALINLTAGHHWIEARMFDHFGYAALTVSYSGPGIPKQVIPPEAFLWHKPVFTSRTSVQTNRTAGPLDYVAMATNVSASDHHIFRVVAANAQGTNYGPIHSAVMGSPGAFTALYLNGVSACVQVPDGTNALAFPARNPFTLEAWIQPESLAATQVVVSKFNQPAAREYYLALNGAGQVVFHRQGSDHVSTTVVPTGQFTHIAATYDGSTRRIYVNGMLDSAVDPGSTDITNTTAPFVIGARYWSNSLADFFQGAIDDVRVWEVARSPVQIAEDRNRRLSGYELGLLAYYRFDEAQDVFATDSTVHQNVGWLVNGPAYIPSAVAFDCASAPPVLSIDRLDFAPGVILWWPITCNEYVLEEAFVPNAPPAEWYPVLEPITPVGQTYLMVVLWDRYEDGYFRLRRR